MWFNIVVEFREAFWDQNFVYPWYLLGCSQGWGPKNKTVMFSTARWWCAACHGVGRRQCLKLGQRCSGTVFLYQAIPLPETNSSPLKMDGWNTTFPIGEAYFQGRTVSFREGNICTLYQWYHATSCKDARACSCVEVYNMIILNMIRAMEILASAHIDLHSRIS